MTLVDWIIVVILGLAVAGGLPRDSFAPSAPSAASSSALSSPHGIMPASPPFLPSSVLTPSPMPLPSSSSLSLSWPSPASSEGPLQTLHHMGLGFLDRLAGAAFGFLQGALMITLCILIAIAFFPQAHWLAESQLPRIFFGACHLTTHMSPAELAERVRQAFACLKRNRLTGCTLKMQISNRTTTQPCQLWQSNKARR